MGHRGPGLRQKAQQDRGSGYHMSLPAGPVSPEPRQGTEAVWSTLEASGELSSMAPSRNAARSKSWLNPRGVQGRSLDLQDLGNEQSKTVDS